MGFLIAGIAFPIRAEPAAVKLCSPRADDHYCLWLNSVIAHHKQWMLYYGAGDRHGTDKLTATTLRGGLVGGFETPADLLVVAQFEGGVIFFSSVGTALRCRAGARFKVQTRQRSAVATGEEANGTTTKIPGICPVPSPRLCFPPALQYYPPSAFCLYG